MNRNAWLGPLVLIGLGALLLANNLSWDLPWRHLLREWWPAAIIALGVYWTAEAGAKRQSMFGGVMVALFGAALLISRLNPELSFGHLVGTYWPLLLIACGLSQLARLDGWRGNRPPNLN
jgi:hypothetical protein